MSLLQPTLDEQILAALTDASRFDLAAQYRRRLQQREHKPVIEFDWLDARTFEIDGQRLDVNGRAVPLAWALLANHSLRICQLRPEHFFQNHAKPARNMRQALDDAEEILRPYSRPLAACIATLGTAGGVLVPKRPQPAIVVCRSPLLQRLAA